MRVKLSSLFDRESSVMVKQGINIKTICSNYRIYLSLETQNHIYCKSI